MNVLVTGASGMLGSEVCKVFAGTQDISLFSTSRSMVERANHRTFDLLESSYTSLFEWSKPDVVIHCAAMTNVDLCEKDQDLAQAVNVGSVSKLLEAMRIKSTNTKLFFISSDAVKAEGQPMAIESCRTMPLNFYGQTKLDAEKLILTSNLQSTVIRTTIVGSKKHLGQSSFVDGIIERTKNKEKSHLFTDAIFTPISCMRLTETIQKILFLTLPKILHIAGAEAVSKYDFGTRLLEEMGLSSDFVDKSKLIESGLFASRLRDQSLSSSFLNRLTGISSPTVLETIHELIGAYNG